MRRSAVCTHRYADCLLINTSTKHSKYVVNQTLEHFDAISFREIFVRIRVFFFVFFLQNKTCPFLLQGICIYVVHSFLWNTVGLILLIYPLVLSGNSWVEVNFSKAITRGEEPWLYIYSNSISECTSDLHHPWSS